MCKSIDFSNPQQMDISLVKRSTSGREVKFSYLPEDRVDISVKNERGQYIKVKEEDVPKELNGLSSPEAFGKFLKDTYVKTSVLSNGDTKVYVSQRGPGGMLSRQYAPPTQYAPPAQYPGAWGAPPQGAWDYGNQNKAQNFQPGFQGKQQGLQNAQGNMVGGDLVQQVIQLPSNFVPLSMPKGAVILDKNHILDNGVVYRSDTNPPRALGQYEGMQLIAQLQKGGDC